MLSYWERVADPVALQAKEETAIFDEVDEEDYRSIVRGRLAEDDFIEEDNGVSGYADNGEDHWDRSEEEEDEEDEAEKRTSPLYPTARCSASQPTRPIRALLADAFTQRADSLHRHQGARKEAKKVKAKEKEAAAAKAASRRKAKPVVVAAGANPYLKPKKDEAEVDDFMASLMGDLEGQETVSSKPAYQPKAQPTRFKSLVSGFKRRADDDASSFRSSTRTTSSSDVGASDPLSDPYTGGKDTAPSSDGEAFGQGKKARFDPQIDEDLGGMDSIDFSGPMEGSDFMDVDIANKKAAESSNAGAAAPKEEDEDDDLFVKPAAPVAKPKGPPVRRQLVNASAVKVKPEPVEEKIPSPPSLPSAADVKPAKARGMDWRTATASLAQATVPMAVEDAQLEEEAEPLPMPESLKRKGKNGVLDVVLDTVDALEDDGSLRFWWFDYVEPPGGKLMLVGKVKIRKGKDAGKWTSAVVTVTGIKRKLYVLPRSKGLDGEYLSFHLVSARRWKLTSPRRRGQRARLWRRGRGTRV